MTIGTGIAVCGIWVAIAIIACVTGDTVVVIAGAVSTVMIAIFCTD